MQSLIFRRTNDWYSSITHSDIYLSKTLYILILMCAVVFIACDRSKKDEQLVAHYPFDYCALDFAELNDAKEFGSRTYEDGIMQNAIYLDGKADYVLLPAQIAQYSRTTIATWIYWYGGDEWQRIFDFGSENESIYLTPKADNGTLSFAVRKGNVTIQRLDSSAFPKETWIHVAVTIGDGQVKLYVNGAVVASAFFHIDPSTIVKKNIYIGKSQRNDSFLYGKIDDFRIYNEALSEEQITSLIKNTVPFADIQNYTPPEKPITSLTNETTPFANTHNYSPPKKPTNPINELAPFINYKFEGNIQDSISSFNATYIGIVTYKRGIYGQAISLNGEDAHLILPNNIPLNVPNMTISTWVNWAGGASWQRIFDFGAELLTEMIFLTPSNDNGLMCFGLRKEQLREYLTGPALPTGQWMHIAVCIDNGQSYLYVNGTLIDKKITTLNPTLIQIDNLYIGRSKFIHDPTFHGLIDDFKIYPYALSEEQIQYLMFTK